MTKTREDLLKIIKSLVSYQTTNDNFAAITECYNYVDRQLDFFPFHKKIINHNGVKSRLWTTTKNKHHTYILNAHVDVVPGSNKLFALRRKNDKLFGRGVSDMKYAIAVYIQTLRTLYEKTKRLPSLALILTADEERGGLNGTGYLVKDLGYRADLAFVPDGAENDRIVEEAKGVLQLKITTRGRSAHAARLWEGISAIDNLCQVIDQLRQKYPFPSKPVWKTTLNLGQISGGQQTNQVADEASLLVDIRYTPNQSTANILENIRKICPGCLVEIVVKADAFQINRQNPYIQKWNQILTKGDKNAFIREDGASDGRYFTAQGIPTIVSKPEGGLIHTEKEWTSLSSIEHFSQCLQQFLS